MDTYGIGSAVLGVVQAYMQGARHTGRTTSLVAQVKDGDRIYFTDCAECERVRRLCLDRGVTVECVVIPRNGLDSLITEGTGKGRTWFDHSAVEIYYLQAIIEARNYIDQLTTHLSGFGTAHLDTKRKATDIKGVSSS